VVEPAGLAGGSYLNGLVEFGGVLEPHGDRDPTGVPVEAWRTGGRGVAVAFPALGLSYYRLHFSEIRPSETTAAAAPDRQDGGRGEVRLTDVSVSQFGATVGQSLGTHLAIGSTLKFVRGSTVSEVRFAADRSLDLAGDLHADATTTRADLRRISGGVEGWLRHRTLGLRGGVSANTIDTARPVASGGVSAALWSGWYLDGQVTVGADRARRGWGMALRVTF
jgi:hypothetical protein